MLRWSALWLGASLTAIVPGAVLRADVIHLKNGKKLEGSLREGAKKGTVEIRTGEGSSITLPETEIEKVEKRPAPAAEFETRLKAVPPRDPDALADLLVWARDKQLYSKVKLVARSILEIDPNHELARKELGFVVFENRWILEEELKKRKGLVRFNGEWMPQAERERRLADQAAKEIEELFSLVTSDNPHIQEYAVRKVFSRRELVAREVFARHLTDKNEAVRWIAARGLKGFPVTPGGGAAEKRIASDLHLAALSEQNEKALEVFYQTLKSFYPEESFRLALETVTGSDDPAARERAAAILYRLLAKAWVPELCRAVAQPGGKTQRQEVRDVLKKSLGVDHGYDAGAWLRFWEENQGRFRDE